MYRVKLVIAFLLITSTVFAKVRVAYLPFEDKVKLNEAWVLSTDVPRWFSQTVDTIASKDTLISSIPFDSTALLIQQNKWKRLDYMASPTIQRIGGRYGADFVISGTVGLFKVMKRGVNTDGSINATSTLTSSIGGHGGGNAMAGLQSYTADVRITLSVYSGVTGALVETMIFDTQQKEGGIKIWLPIQSAENEEVNFHYVSRTPFGSLYFQRSVIGTVMRTYSLELHNKILALAQKPTSVASIGVQRDFVKGKVLDRSGADFYLNVGSADDLLLGDVFEVVRQDRPVMGKNNDTLGWTEKVVGKVKIRDIKSAHFSQAIAIDSTEPLQVGWDVRMGIGTKP